MTFLWPRPEDPSLLALEKALDSALMRPRGPKAQMMNRGVSSAVGPFAVGRP